MSEMLFVRRFVVWMKADIFLLVLSIFRVMLFSAHTSMNFSLAVLREHTKKHRRFI